MKINGSISWWCFFDDFNGLKTKFFHGTDVGFTPMRDLREWAFKNYLLVVPQLKKKFQFQIKSNENKFLSTQSIVTSSSFSTLVRLSYKMLKIQFNSKCVAFVFTLLVIDIVQQVNGNPMDKVLGTTTSEHQGLDYDQIYEVTPLCSSKKRTIIADNLIKSVEEGFDFDKNFAQTIEVEMCENVGSPCSHNPMIKTKCKQKYLTIQLQVVSRNTTLSQLHSFMIPSNCECAYLRP